MSELDPRLHVFRPDLADFALEGRVNAERFTEADLYTVVAPVADMRRAPDLSEGLVSQALYGEEIAVFELENGWAWGQLQTDGYVGYFREYDLAAKKTRPTHWVSERMTFVYPRADIKSVPLMALSYGSRLSVEEQRDEFMILSTGGFAFAKHVRAQDHAATDIVTELQKFIHTPYLWGGRSAFGLDCSCLVQLVLAANGFDCPADSDMQAQSPLLGGELKQLDPGKMHRGDLVFWKGHVGVMLDETRFIHANGHHMKVVIEPLVEAIERIASLHNRPIGFRRLLG